MLQLQVSLMLLSCVVHQVDRKAIWLGKWYHCVIMQSMLVLPNPYGPGARLRTPLTLAANA